jgi:hypothetical protein
VTVGATRSALPGAGARDSLAGMESSAAMEPVHDFTGKLRQPSLLPRVTAYVEWRRALGAARARGEAPPPMPALGPLSVNLDLTTACNYACAHCIDWDVLNSGISHEDARLRASVAEMAARGLRSVILIGGGEPTLYPGFSGFVGHLKDLSLDVAIVSNGGRGDRILEAMPRLGPRDWVRLSLDAGTDETFQRMHRPKKPVTLDEICAWVGRWKAANPAPRVGFSFVVTWRGAVREPGAEVVENLDEIPLAARRARDAGFDYVSFKPFLVRRGDGAEVMDPAQASASLDATVARIRARLEEAEAFAGPAFRVVESTNLRVLESGTWRALTRQPRTCHMQALRQVLSPMGLYNCPAHRGAEKARIAGRDAYATPEACAATAAATADILDRFDASAQCREVTCLYHATNWWIEAAIEDPRVLDRGAVVEGEDAFL